MTDSSDARPRLDKDALPRRAAGGEDLAPQTRTDDLTERLRAATEDIASRPEDYARRGMPRPPQQHGVGEIPDTEIVIKYCRQAADYVSGLGAEIKNLAESFDQESRALADNFRRLGDLEARRSSDFIKKMNAAAKSLEGVRTSFKEHFDTVAREREIHDVDVTQELEKHLRRDAPLEPGRD